MLEGIFRILFHFVFASGVRLSLFGFLFGFVFGFLFSGGRLFPASGNSKLNLKVLPVALLVLGMIRGRVL